MSKIIIYLFGLLISYGVGVLILSLLKKTEDKPTTLHHISRVLIGMFALYLISSVFNSLGCHHSSSDDSEIRGFR